jgi:hypothetical protein
LEDIGVNGRIILKRCVVNTHIRFIHLKLLTHSPEIESRSPVLQATVLLTEISSINV